MAGGAPCTCTPERWEDAVSRRKLRAAAVAALALVGIVVTAPRAEAAEVRLRPTSDGFKAEPRTNLGDRSWLTTNGQGGRRKRIYLKFRMRGIPRACRGEAWASFWAVVKPFYDWLGASGHGDKPFMLGEYGTVDDPGQPGRKATWFNRQVSQLAGFPNLRALVYFDRNQDCDWRVGSAPGSLAAYGALSAAVG
jgi:hypothetical protein